MDELRLYRIVIGKLTKEAGWVDATSFYVWIYYSNVYEFMGALKEIFGIGIFDKSDFNANIQEDCLCINISTILEEYVDLEAVFPQEEFCIK